MPGIRQTDSDHFCNFQMQLTGGCLATVSLNSHVPGPYSHQVTTKNGKIEVSMLQTGVVPRRDVSIIYSAILEMFTQYNYEGYN